MEFFTPMVGIRPPQPGLQVALEARQQDSGKVLQGGPFRNRRFPATVISINGCRSTTNRALRGLPLTSWDWADYVTREVGSSVTT